MSRMESIGAILLHGKMIGLPEGVRPAIIG